MDNEKYNAEEEMRDIMTYLKNNEELRHMIWINGIYWIGSQCDIFRCQ